MLISADLKNALSKFAQPIFIFFRILMGNQQFCDWEGTGSTGIPETPRRPHVSGELIFRSKVFFGVEGIFFCSVLWGVDHPPTSQTPNQAFPFRWRGGGLGKLFFRKVAPSEGAMGRQGSTTAFFFLGLGPWGDWVANKKKLWQMQRKNCVAEKCC